MARLRAGDNAAAAEVFRRFANRLIGLARTHLDARVRQKVDPEDVMQSALKSFESTMKAICARRKWPYPESATAKVLLDVLFANGVVPPQLQSEFTSLRTVLESGLPTVRNKTPSVGHGQGSMPVPVPDHLVAFALHLAAANIVFLVEADAARP